MEINRNPDNRIEINRCGSLINFDRIFEVLNNKAWNIAIEGTKKKRVNDHAEFERMCDMAKESVDEIIHRLFDLEQAVAAMPEEVRDSVWNRCWELKTERESIEEDED